MTLHHITRHKSVSCGLGWVCGFTPELWQSVQVTCFSASRVYPGVKGQWKSKVCATIFHSDSLINSDGHDMEKRYRTLGGVRYQVHDFLVIDDSWRVKQLPGRGLYATPSMGAKQAAVKTLVFEWQAYRQISTQRSDVWVPRELVVERTCEKRRRSSPSTWLEVPAT